MVSLFLDDVRNPPNDFVGIVCRTAEEAVEYLNQGSVSYISFDHDLGTELTGYDVAKFIEEKVYYKEIPCPEWNIHSANPVGVKNIRACMESAQKIFYQ